MRALLLMLLQASAEPAPPPPVERIDILRALAEPRCEPGIGDEIVVCGSREDEQARYRLEPLPDRYDERPLKAETTIGPVRAGVAVEGAEVGGFTSNRVMLKLKLPF